VADVSARMLALLSALQTGRAWPSAELAARLGTSPRTLRRDVDRLRGLGYPVEARPGPGGHYRLVAGTAVPPLLLEDDEAVAIAVGLQLAAADDPASAAARRALRKLQQLLPARLRRAVGAVEAGTEVPDAPAADTAQLRRLVEAVQRGERVAFGYRARDRSTSERTVDPARVVRFGGRWYLLAFDVDRADWRTFRLDRVTGVRATGQHATPRELPAESGAAFLDRSLRGPRHRAVLVLDAAPEELAGLLGTDGDLEALPDGRTRFSTRVDSFPWLAITTAVLDVPFRVEEPAEFAEYCHALAARLGRA
jgi:predicted DNA-binding transcriptional regulator YafY